MTDFRANKPPKEFKDFQSSENTMSTGKLSDDLDPLFNFPSLDRLFDGHDSQSLLEMRSRLARTSQDLERVIRQGTKEDSARATHVSRAFNLTLALLEELGRRQLEEARTKKS